MLSPLPYTSDAESVPYDEAVDIEKILQLIQRALQEKERRTGTRQRDVHVKMHGCATSLFQVLNDLPLELRQGLFQEPKSYPASVRFSNSSPVALADAVPDGRGMAIQVENIAGEFLPAWNPTAPTQDFVMVNHPVFIARDVKDYFRLQVARLESESHPLRGPAGALTNGSWNPAQWKWREAWSAVQVALQPPSHPLANTYYSMVPIRFGDYIAKYRVRLKTNNQHKLRGNALLAVMRKRDGLRDVLEQSIRLQEVVFEFQVQLRTSAQTMPIEDATVRWPEGVSPYQTVAALTLPIQDITAHRQAGERRSFSVWHALEAHRPLGGINRVRRQAYALSASWRDAVGNIAPSDFVRVAGRKQGEGAP
ncbi:MAG TPA: catalase family protein [Planctomycetaceae bacterium]|nr:catalase family protein [Planctomycetaceae bacterium]